MLKRLQGTNILAMIADLIGSIILAMYALIVGPLGVLRGPIAMERTFWYLWALLPQGLLTRSIRAAIDWRLGNFDSAITQLEGLVGSNEEYFKDKPSSRARRRVLEDLYTVLTRAYLHAGHVDDAMLVVIRAKKTMRIERLTGLSELDAKTAHLVRAGLAAGRLLDGGGLATMFVKTNAKPNSENSGADPERAGASAKDTENPKGSQDADDSDAPKKGGKIIPFPPGDQLSP